MDPRKPDTPDDQQPEVDAKPEIDQATKDRISESSISTREAIASTNIPGVPGAFVLDPLLCKEPDWLTVLTINGKEQPLYKYEKDAPDGDFFGFRPGKRKQIGTISAEQDRKNNLDYFIKDHPTIFNDEQKKRRLFYLVNHLSAASVKIELIGERGTMNMNNLCIIVDKACDDRAIELAKMWFEQGMEVSEYDLENLNDMKPC